MLAGDGQARLRRCCTGCGASDGLPGHPDVARRARGRTRTPARSAWASRRRRGFARAARLARRPAPRVRPHRRRRAAGGPVLGVARPGRERGLRRDHRRSSTTTRSSRTRGSSTSATCGDLEAKVARVRLGRRALRRQRRRARSRAALERARGRRAGHARSCSSPTRSRARACSPSSRTSSSRAGTSLYAFHSGAPAPDEYDAALAELAGRLEQRLGRGAGARARRGAATRRRPRAPQRLVAAYGEALVEAAEREERLVALDADLYLDCGLIPFRERFPERFVECGIAEQDMVSQAGGAGARRARCRSCTRSPASSSPRAERADLQQRDRGHEGPLRRLPRRHRPGRAGPLAPVRARHRADGQRAGHGLPRARHGGGGARVRRRGRCTRPRGPSTSALVSVPWELGFEPPRAGAARPGPRHRRARGRSRVLVAHGPGAALPGGRPPPSGSGDVARRRRCRGCATSTARGSPRSRATRRSSCSTTTSPRGGQGDAVRAALRRPARRRVLGVEGVPGLRHERRGAARARARRRERRRRAIGARSA